MLHCPFIKCHRFVCCKYFYGIHWTVYCLSCRLINYFFGYATNIFIKPYVLHARGSFWWQLPDTQKVYIDRITVWYYTWLVNTFSKLNIYSIYFTNPKFVYPMTKIEVSRNNMGKFRMTYKIRPRGKIYLAPYKWVYVNFSTLWW